MSFKITNTSEKYAYSVRDDNKKRKTENMHRGHEYTTMRNNTEKTIVESQKHIEKT